MAAGDDQVGAETAGRGDDLVCHITYRRVPAIDPGAQMTSPDLVEKVLERLLARGPLSIGLRQVAHQDDKDLCTRLGHGCHRRCGLRGQAFRVCGDQDPPIHDVLILGWLGDRAYKIRRESGPRRRPGPRGERPW